MTYSNRPRITSTTTLAISGVMFCFSVALAGGEPDKAALGASVWSAFECSTYAEMSGEKKEQARLFSVGLKTGRGFIEALKSGQISKDAFNREVPGGVEFSLQGPTIDFIVGRIFEVATRFAFDKVEKEPGRDDKERAQMLFGDRNCVLIK